MASQLPDRASPSRDETRDTSRVDTLLKTPTTLSLSPHQTRSAIPKELVTHIQEEVIRLLQVHHPKEKITTEISLKGSTVTDWLMGQEFTADLDFVIKFLYNPDTAPPFSFQDTELNELMQTVLLNAFIRISGGEGGSALLELNKPRQNSSILQDLPSSLGIDYQHIFHPTTGTFKKPLTSFQDTTKKIWKHITCFRLAKPTQAACAAGPEVDITCVFCPQELASSPDFLHNAVSILIRDREYLVQFSENQTAVIQALRERSIVVLDPQMHNGLFRLLYEAVGKGRHICNKPEDYTKGITLLAQAVDKPKSFQFFWKFMKEKSQSRGPDFPLYFLMTAYTTASLIARAGSRSEQGASTALPLDPLGFFKKIIITNKAQYLNLLPYWAQQLFNEPGDQCPLESLAQIATLQAHFSPSEQFEVTPAADEILRITGNRWTGYLHCFDKSLEELLSLVTKLPDALLQSALTEILTSIPKQIKGHDRWLWLFSQTYGTDKEIKIAQKENIAGYLPTLARFQLMESKLTKTDTPQFRLHQLLQDLILGIDEQVIPTSYKELLNTNPTLSPELTCLLPAYQASMPKPALQAGKDSLLKGSPAWLLDFHRFYPVEGKDLAALLVKDTHPSLESIQFINALSRIDETGILTFHCFKALSNIEDQQACFRADPEKWSQLLSMQPLDPQTFIPCLLATTTLAGENECLLAAKYIQTKLLQMDRPVKLALKYLPRLKELILKHGISFFREYPKLILDLSTANQKGKPNEDLDLYLKAENKELTDGDLKIAVHVTRYATSKKQDQAQILKDLLDLSSTHPLPIRLIEPLLTAVSTNTHNSTVEAQKSLLAFIRWAACSQINPGQLDRYLEKKQIQTLYATELKLDEQLQHCSALKNYPSWPIHAPAYHSTLKIRDALKPQDKEALSTYFAAVKRNTPQVFSQFIEAFLIDTKTKLPPPQYPLLLDLLINEPGALTPAQQMPLIIKLLERARIEYPTIHLGTIDTYLKAIETSLDPDALDQLILQVSFLIGTSATDRMTINTLGERILTAILCKPDEKNSLILIDNILELPEEALTSASWQKLLTPSIPLSIEHLHAVVSRCLATLPSTKGKEKANVLAQQCEIAQKYHILAEIKGISTDWTDGHTFLYQSAIQSQNWTLLQLIQKLQVQLPLQTGKQLKKEVIALLKTSLDIKLIQQVGPSHEFNQDDYLSIYWAMVSNPVCIQTEDLLTRILALEKPCEENFNQLLPTIKSHLKGDMFHALALILKAWPLFKEEKCWKNLLFKESRSVCKDLAQEVTPQRLEKPLNSLSAFYTHLFPLMSEGKAPIPPLNNESEDLKIKYFLQFQGLVGCLVISTSDYAELFYTYTANFLTRKHLENIEQLTYPEIMQTKPGLHFICTQIDKGNTKENIDFLFRFYLALSSSIDTITQSLPYFQGILERNIKAAAHLCTKKTLTLDETEYLLVLTLFNDLSAFILGNTCAEIKWANLLDQAKKIRIQATESLLGYYPIDSAIPQEFVDKYGVILLASEYEKSYSTEVLQQIKRLKGAMSLFKLDSTLSISHELFHLIFKAVHKKIEQMPPDHRELPQIADLRHCLTTLISSAKVPQDGETISTRQNQMLFSVNLIMTSLCQNYRNITMVDLLLDEDLIKDWLLPIAVAAPKANALVYLLRRTMILPISRETSQSKHSDLFEIVLEIVNQHEILWEASADSDMVRSTLQEVYRTVTANEEFQSEIKRATSLGQKLNQFIALLCRSYPELVS